MSAEPNYKALLEEALIVCLALDEMLDGFLDSTGATTDEIDNSRRLYNRVAAIHRALGRAYVDIPVDDEEEEERDLADIGGIPA